MKYLLFFIFSLLCASAQTQTVISPQCQPQVAVGGGLSVDSCPAFVPDPRRVNIQAYWEAFAIYPAMIFDAMRDFNVSADELEDVMDYKVNIYRYLRFNGAPDGLGGLKVWDAASIDQYLDFNYISRSDQWQRVYAQDALDLAARREALYIAYGIPVPDGVAPWKHPRVAPVPEVPAVPCVAGQPCVAVSP